MFIGEFSAFHDGTVWLLSHSVMSDSGPNGLQHARLPWPSPSPGVSSNSCPLSCWCHPTVSSSVIPFFSCLQFFPASESSPVSWLFALGGQRIETSALASVLPINSQSSFPLGLNGLLAVQGTVKSLLQHHSQKASILQHSLFFNCLVVTSIHQFSCSIVSNSLRSHGLQHTRPPCPSPARWVYSNSCPLSQWCHPTISSSTIPFSSCLQSFPASGSFPVSQFFASGGQSIGVSASASVLPVNIQDWSPLGWTGWISLQTKGLSRVFSNTTVQKYQFFGAQLSL